MKRKIGLLLCGTVVMVSLGSCDILKKDSDGPADSQVQVTEITKWPNGFQAVYTPTLDAGLPSRYDEVNQWLKDNELFIDYEIVTASYDIRPERVEFMRDSLIPYGFGYFGHGHAHDNHDHFDYDESYESFRQNFLSIKSYGFKPVAYAYPYGAGRQEQTRKALEDAGFLSGRLNQTEFEGYGPCILPGEESEPPDWFALPALRMENYEFEQCSHCINDPDEFFSYFDPCVEQGAWVISTYHAIGFDGVTGPVGWGYYRRSHFFEEMSRIKELQDDGIVWLANMSDATLYARQRHHAYFELEEVEEDKFRLVLDDGLDREIYSMPLTLRIQFSSDLMDRELRISKVDSDEVKIKQIENEEMMINLHPSESSYLLRII